MKCHIAQNGGFMLLIVYLWISAANSRVLKSVYTIQEFCSGNLFMHNIEAGDPFQLTLKSEATSTADKWYQKSKRRCLKEFKTSDPAAHFTVDITDMNIPSCSNCRCNYFDISEQSYKKRFCGTRESESFITKSDTVSIDFHHAMYLVFDVTLTFTVERNSYIITGTPSEHGAGSYLETPYFSNAYPPNYRAEYVLRSDEVGSHVVLLFLDFQISHQSFIEVAGNNGTHPTRYYGSTFRPPVIVSQRNQLDVKFQSNDQLGRPGFRALTSFVRTVDSLSVPYTDCGGLKHGRGGSMNIKTHETFSLYDCVWHISNPLIRLDEPVHSILYLSVSIQFKDIGYKSYLEFRRGDNSKSNLVKVINCEIEKCADLNMEMTVAASRDLYIRFNGYLDVYSILDMSYSIYHTKNCTDSEFMCEGGRCLIFDFRCDGIKQCPSGSDEENCPTAVIPEVWIPSAPTIKRVNGEVNAVYKKFFILLLVGSFGLVAVLIAVFIFLYKYRKIVPGNAEQAQPQVIGEMSGVPPSLHPSNPYGNDSLPTYDDFIKSSEFYPPLLYTRAKQRIIPKDICINCTTSFSTGVRTRHHSADSHSYRRSDTGSDIFISNSRDLSQQACSNIYNVEAFNNAGPNTSGTIKKWYSLDSRLDDLARKDSCHLFLSIIHPACSHADSQLTQIQCHTLPPNFKISTAKSGVDDIVKLNDPVWLSFNSNRNTDRRCTWSFIPHSSSGSEILTVVKARCCSDPCKGISVHCSMY